jgi:hypothetical protein
MQMLDLLPKTISRAVRRRSIWRSGVLMVLTVVGGWFGATASVSAEHLDEAPLSTRDLHVWGRFSPGTWKQVRVVTETLNDRGEVSDTTTTDTKSTLLSVSSQSIRLKIDLSVEVGGKRFAGESRVIEHGFFCERPSDASELKLLGAAQITIDGQRLPCQVRQVVAHSGGQQLVTKLYLSESIEPFVLKREVSTVESNGHPVDNTSTTAEVIALDMPYRVQREMKTAAFERTIQRTPKGTNVTLDVTCVDIPGGIVARTSKELDEKGRLLRRSTLELVDYHSEVEEASGDDGVRYLTRRQARKAARRGR